MFSPFYSTTDITDRSICKRDVARRIPPNGGSSFLLTKPLLITPNDFVAWHTKVNVK